MGFRLVALILIILVVLLLFELFFHVFPGIPSTRHIIDQVIDRFDLIVRKLLGVIGHLAAHTLQSFLDAGHEIAGSVLHSTAGFIDSRAPNFCRGVCGTLDCITQVTKEASLPGSGAGGLGFIDLVCFDPVVNSRDDVIINMAFVLFY